MKIMLAFCGNVCYYMQVLWGTREYPGVAKFGIALEWGSRGLEFESRHSDQEELTCFDKKLVNSSFFSDRDSKDQMQRE